MRYTDGDQEDLDLEEYNFAYALWLQKEGWDADEDDFVYGEFEADAVFTKLSPEAVFVLLDRLLPW